MDPDEEEEDEDGNPIARDKSNTDTASLRANSISNRNSQVSSKDW